MIAEALKERVMATFAINTDFIRRHTVQMVLTILGFSGVVAVFFPFIYGYIAVEFFLGGLDWDDELAGFLALLGSFVVLPFFISAGYLHWLFTTRLSRWETWLGYALALIVVVLLSLSMIQEWWKSYVVDKDILWLGCVLLGLGAGVWFVIKNLRHKTPLTLTALVAMQFAYLPFALFWLGLPIGELIEGDTSSIGIGAYLAFLTVLVYTAQAALSVRGQSRLPLRLLPLGVVWVAGLTAGFIAWP